MSMALKLYGPATKSETEPGAQTADEVKIACSESWSSGSTALSSLSFQKGRLKSIGAAHFSSNATTPKMNSAPSAKFIVGRCAAAAIASPSR